VSETPAPVEGVHLVGPAELRVAWSLDGTQIACTYQAEAWIHDLDSGQSQRVTDLTEGSLCPARVQPS